MKPWDIFETFDDYVYVADTETHDLVFANRKLRELCDPSGSHGIVGRKCHEVLKSTNVPCASCDNTQLNPNEFATTRAYHPVLGKRLNFNTMLLEHEGRTYRLGVWVDSGQCDDDASEDGMDRTLESLASETLRIALKCDTPEEAIQVVLKFTCKSLNGVRSYVFERDERGIDQIVYRYEVAGEKPVTNLVADAPDFSYKWRQSFEEHGVLIVEDVEELRETDPEQYAALQSIDITSMYMVPLVEKGEVFGFYGVDNPSGGTLDRVINILHMMADFIQANIKRRDLDQRLQHEEAERAVAKRERQIGEVLSGAHMGVWSMVIGDGEPRFYPDDQVAFLVGSKPDDTPETAYNVWNDHIGKDYYKVVTDTLQEILAGEASEVEYLYHHPDGHTLTVRCGGVRDEAYEGPGISVRGYHQDISDYSNMVRMREVVIKSLSGDYSSIFMLDLVTGMVRIEKMEGYVVEGIDPRQRERFDYNTMLTTYIDARIHPDDKDDMRTALTWGAIAGGLESADEYNASYRTMEEDGVHHFQLKATRGGEGEAVIGFRNIDSAVERELAQRSIVEDALARAEYANRAKTQFLNSMSHDIRTPMNAIIGFTTLASKHLDDPTAVADYLQKIRVSSDHLLSLINDVLDMSRIESGKISISESEASISQLVRDIGMIVHATAADKNQTLTIDASNVTNDAVWCDKLRLEQVLINCLSNAVKFTPEGGHVGLAVRQQCSPEDGHATYEFTVTDTGIGMSPEFVEHVFEPFARESTSTVSGIQGTGLGLAISKNIVEMMNGEITAESQQGEGSTFTITIDFKLANADVCLSGGKVEVSAPADSDADEPDAANPLEGVKILLVEDNEFNRIIATELLTERGAVLDIAEDGSIAVQKMQQAQADAYDIVLMDVQMPIMNGYEATRQIRALADEAKASIPIIATTADAFAEDRKLALEAGMNAHVPKPLDIAELTETVRGLLKR